MLRLQRRHSVPTIGRILAGPLHTPITTGWGREQRLGERWAVQIPPQVDEKHTVAKVIVGEESKHERVRLQHRAVYSSGPL